MNEIEQAKVTMLGDANAGKSSIIQRYIANTFSDHSTPTIGATFLSKIIDFDKQSLKLCIWDTAGQERYYSLAASYSRDSKACVIVYDITSRDSFTNLNRWYTSIKDQVTPDTIIVIVGNKDDLVNKEATSLEEAQEYAKSINAMYMRTSAKLGSGIKELFLEISREILGNDNLSVRSTIKSMQSVSLIKRSSQDPKKKQCC